jgi:hypothetical protein
MAKRQITQDQRDYLRQVKELSDDDINRLYVVQPEVTVLEPDLGPDENVGAVRGTVLSALRAVPFSDELGAAVRSLPRLVPGGQSFGDAYRENKAAFQQGVEQFSGEHPIAAAGTTLAATVPLLALATGGTGALGAARSAAVLGGMDAAGAAEGAGNRLKAGALGAGVGGLLGGVVHKVFGLGRAALPVAGAAIGGTQAEGDLSDRALGAGVGAGAGAVAGRAGGALVAKLSRMTPKDLAAGKLADAARRAGITPAGLRQAERTALPGETVMELAGPNNPMVRLAGSAQRTNSQGAKQLGDFVAQRTKLGQSQAERAVNKAMGSTYSEAAPAVSRVKGAIRAETAPAYRQLQGVEVSSAPLAALAADEPMVANLWKSAQELAKKRAKAGYDDAVELPDLFDADGAIAAERIPVLGFDMVKRALRREVQRTRNSPNPLTSEDAKVLERRLSQVVETARQEAPDYAAALKNFGAVSDKYKRSLTAQKQTENSILGNSKTAERMRDDADFSDVRLSSLTPRGLAKDVLDSRVANWLRGMDEKTVDELVPMLVTELREGGGSRLAGQLEDYLAARAQRLSRLSTLPRVAAGATGIGIGGQFRGTDERSTRR